MISRVDQNTCNSEIENSKTVQKFLSKKRILRALIHRRKSGPNLTKNSEEEPGLLVYFIKMATVVVSLV